MWISKVIILSYLCLIYFFHSGNPSEVHACHDNSWECPDSTPDVASTIINDLYKVISKAESELANPNDYPPDYRPSEGEEFDFIVVGAGSAGAVVANRLTEISSWKVLLIEAGGNPTKTTEPPGLAPRLQSTDIDWQFRSDPEESACLGMVNNGCFWPRGKVLGGTSSINFMEYVRGNAKDFDIWADAGNTGWTYEEVLPFFKKSEDMRVSDVLKMKGWEKYHGKGGYLSIESWPYSETDPLMEIFGKGFEELGYPFNVDYNGEKQTGFSRFHATLKNSKRCSTAKAFLSPVKDRTNLKVAKYSHVTKILIDKYSSMVLGVEFINKEGKTVQVKSKKEVVLSAGAISSPQILMLSGVGPKPDLQNLGLPIVKDLPVGKNLQDHFLMNTLVISVNYSVPPQNTDLTRSMFEFLTTGSGDFSNLRSLNYGAFVNTVRKDDDDDFPDMEFLPVHFSRNDVKALTGFFQNHGIRKEFIDKYVEINKHRDSMILIGSLLRPFSRGKVSLKDSDPKTHPKLVSGTYSDDRDVETYLRVYSFMEEFVQTEAMKSLDAKLHEVRLEGCEKHLFRSREYRECSLRHLTPMAYHYSGTCKMGPPSDPGAVVDPSLKVYGVKGLRVADASIMPTIVSANINAAVIMIGEKAADLIKNDWQKRDEL